MDRFNVWGTDDYDMELDVNGEYVRFEDVATLTAERDKLREMVVWAVQHGACAGFDGSSWPCITYAPNGPVTYDHHKMSDLVNYDGTPASILAAVERAMGDTKPPTSSP
jgi:hypothetical protein